MHCLIYSTFPDAATARAVAGLLVNGKLAACCNLIPGMRSIYHWEGQLREDEEVVLLCKTVEAKAEALIEAIVTAHPYDCPAVLRLPVAGGNPLFLEWITQQTGG